MGIRAMAAKLTLARKSTGTKGREMSLPLVLKDKKLLVLLPSEQRDLTVVKQVLPEITNLFGDDQVYLMSMPDVDIRSIFPHKGYRMITPTKANLNWCQLPNREYLDKLREYKFDYIFDTNLEDNMFAQRILLHFPDAVRFGSTGRLGPPYLNLEIKTKYLRDRRLIYRSILEVVANLARAQSSQVL